MLVISTSLSWRAIAHAIKALLHSGAAQTIKRINYVKDYKIVDKKIVKTEQKILLIGYNDEKKLMWVLDKTISDRSQIELTSQV